MDGLLLNVLPVAARSSPSDRLAALFEAHHDRLYRPARRLPRSADDELNLVQQAFSTDV
jgi:DNA-directed RNA polymerase specialized sigma24 family protein